MFYKNNGISECTTSINNSNMLNEYQLKTDVDKLYTKVQVKTENCIKYDEKEIYDNFDKIHNKCIENVNVTPIVQMNPDFFKREIEDLVPDDENQEVLQESIHLLSKYDFNPDVTSLHSEFIIKTEDLGDNDRKTDTKIDNKENIQYPCNLCTKTFRCPEIFDAHKTWHINQDNKIKKSDFNCKLCNISFSSRSKMLEHRNEHISKINVANNKYKFQCKICETLFCEKGAASKHIVTMHVGETPYKCDKCGKQFKTRSNLQSHIRTHDKSIYKICSCCNKEYYTKEGYAKHMIRMTSDKIYKCSVCDKTFPAEQFLKRHEKHHDISRKLPCDKCDKSFFDTHHLNKHQVVHITVRKFKCDECDKSYATENHLRRHKYSSHSEYRFTCDYCERKFRLKHVWLNHLNYHTGERPWKCNNCGQCFTALNTLKIHKIVHNKTERNFKCDQCHKAFYRMANLYTHKLIHSGEKRFSCDLCSMKFLLRHHLRSHLKTHTTKKE